MKKYFNAQFALECIIVDGADSPEYELRDRNGTIAARGSIDEVVSFLDESFQDFQKQRSKSADKADR